MPEDKRPVSYQQTLGTKTERIREQSKEQNQNRDDGTDLKKIDANFPE
ncbi:hypothetical protein [Mesobacillus harenae]|nr:hypothetical protein [Mesobacillus harenae]